MAAGLLSSQQLQVQQLARLQATHQVRATLWKAPQEILAILSSLMMRRGCLLSCALKSPQGSPHVHTWPHKRIQAPRQEQRSLGRQA